MSSPPPPFSLCTSTYISDSPVRSLACAKGWVHVGSQQPPFLVSVNLNTKERIDYPTLPVSNQVTAVLPIISNDVTTLLIGSLDNNIYKIDTSTRSSVGVYPGHQHGVISLCLSASDPNEFFSGSWDGTCRRWSLDPPELLDTLEGHTNGVSVRHHACGSLVTSDTGSAEPGTSKLRVWNLDADGRYVVSQSLVPHSGPIRGLCLPNAVDSGCPVVTCGNDGQVTFVDVNGGGDTRGVIHRVQTDATYLLDVDW